MLLRRLGNFLDSRGVGTVGHTVEGVGGVGGEARQVYTRRPFDDDSPIKVMRSEFA